MNHHKSSLIIQVSKIQGGYLRKLVENSVLTVRKSSPPPGASLASQLPAWPGPGRPWPSGPREHLERMGHKVMEHYWKIMGQYWVNGLKMVG